MAGSIAHDTKTCSKCAEEKPLDAFYPYPYRHKDAVTNQCKKCICAQKRAYALANPEKMKERNSSRREYLHTRYLANKEKHAEQMKAWYRANPDYQREYSKEWVKRNPKKRAEFERRYRLKYPEKAKAKAARYRLKHPLHIRERNKRRKLLQRGVTVGVVSYDKIVDDSNYVCHICGGMVAPWDLNVDHIYPIARGGKHCMENLAVAHEYCNLSKSDKLITLF